MHLFYYFQFQRVDIRNSNMINLYKPVLFFVLISTLVTGK